jgi:hypothetical protein
VKSKKIQQPPAAEGAAGRLKGRARDVGPAADAGTGEKHVTSASRTKTTRKLDQGVKRDADNRMAGREKAIQRWEGEGGAIPPTKKGGRK